MSIEKQYPEVCPMELDIDGGYYGRHVDAMTRENLHSKSDIAAQLGARDREIGRLRAEADALRVDAERYRFLVETGAYAPGRHKSCPLALAMGAHGKCEKEELDEAIDRHMGADA